jgi:hypothetical protein
MIGVEATHLLDLSGVIEIGIDLRIGELFAGVDAGLDDENKKSSGAKASWDDVVAQFLHGPKRAQALDESDRLLEIVNPTSPRETSELAVNPKYRRETSELAVLTYEDLKVSS